ncbi:DUF6134 family protein [Maribacter thermophilus]|uniref:DUF6134 family protein n=1 Tax=Maribacter thermophilus TaxID=1197874 RepID=UPI00069C94F1|nr:DUF6134 family protein [Maribacter thermophilus]
MFPIYQFIIVLFLLIDFNIGTDIPLYTLNDTTLYFDIVLKDKVIGNLKATKNSKDNKIFYQSETAIKTRVIKNIEVNYKYDVTFENKVMKKADVVIDVNNKPHANTVTNWNSSQYQVIKNGKEEEVLETSIDYTTILLYFKEPVNIDLCYSEQDGSFNTIVALGEHSYKKINAKGKENIYYYKNGVLEKASIDGGLVKFEIIARN